MQGGAVATTDRLYSLVANTAAGDISGGLNIGIQEQRWQFSRRLHHDAHAQCYEWAQLLDNHAKSLLTESGLREPEHRHLNSFLFLSNRVFIQLSINSSETGRSVLLNVNDWSVLSGSWWWTGRPGLLRFMVSQRVRHNWATELN